MDTKFSFLRLKIQCRSHVAFLAFSWTFGLVLGMFFAYMTKDHISSLMCTAVYSRVSIVGLVVMLLIPLLLSIVSAYFSLHYIIYSISFFVSFSYGYSMLGSLAAFQSAGWLIHLLFAFSDTLMILILMCFWMRHIDGCCRRLRKDSCICCILALAIGLVDYLFVSPFLMGLIEL